MGATGSVIDNHHFHLFGDDITVEMCVNIVMPIYYTKDSVSPEDLMRARKSWSHILDDTSPAFIEAKKDPNFTEISCLSHFYTVFYGRLFDIHPACKPLFKNSIQIQGKALAKIISFLLKDHTDPVLLNTVLLDMADRHVHQYGVKAHEFGCLGEALIYAFATCVGKEEFDDLTTLAWIRIYSMVISIVVPIHVRHELQEAAKSQLRSVVTDRELNEESAQMEAKRKSISSVIG